MNSSLQATLTQGSVSRHLWTMATPMVLGLLATMSFNFVDTMFVSWLDGEGPLAAMTLTFPVIMVVTSVAIGLGAGASSAIARAVGSGNEEGVRRLATDSITLATLISVLVCVVGWFTIDPLFKALGAGPELMPHVRDYMEIWYLGAPFLLVPMISLSALRALGFARIQGTLMALAALLNAALDPLLIFGFEFIPRMEIQGAALATLITRVLTLFGAIYFLQGRMNVLTSPITQWENIKESWLRVCRVGLPAMVSNLIIPVASFFVIKLVISFGNHAVAGLGAALRIEPVVLIVFYALSGVVGPFSGQNEGAGQHQRLFEMLRVISLFCVGFGLCVALILFIAAPFVVELFDQAEDVDKVVISYLTIVPFSYGAYGLVMSAIAVFNGLGKPVPGFFISFLRVMGLYLPMAFIGKWLFGLTGLFAATALANVLVGLLAYLWLSKTLRENAEKSVPAKVLPVTSAQ